ncbi:MAG: GxxExxY protein [Anaerolineales bacterium]|nr:GxxExxY protein [Anaerolineales bacterium]MCX7608142.1 GxxExxY protein [Anaerolineales bacterium]MDW8227181.1 GxxExxY protein [Anaerolineales bacterium]
MMKEKNGKIIVEIKAVSNLTDAHTAQTLHYLAATKQKVALFINFGSKSLEHRRLML